MNKKGYFDTIYVQLITNLPAKELNELIAEQAVSGYSAKGKYFIEWSALVDLLKVRGKFVPDVFRLDKKSVLVVDDDPLVTKALKRMLDTRGDAVVVTAGNAFEMGKAINSRVPDIVILDFNMPGINGLEVVNMLKGAKDTDEIKVILYSGFITDDLRIEMHDLNVDAVVTKSPDYTTILEAIERLM